MSHHPGGREAHVDRTVPALSALSSFIRAVKSEAGLTYEDLARQGKASRATYQRAASGKPLPRLEIVQEILTLCGRRNLVASERATQLWRNARCALRGTQNLPLPRAQFISDEADMSRALRDLHQWAGSPSAGSIEARSGPHGVPHTTAHRIIQGYALPRSERVLKSFLLACATPPNTWGAWIDAYERVAAARTRRQTVGRTYELAHRLHLFNAVRKLATSTDRL
jgi:transcriptional regulator with XRE-family HTH domain